MTHKPEAENEEPIADVKSLDWLELVAVIAIGSALYLICDIFLQWLARTYDVQMLEMGRRAKLADILAAVAALLLTNLAAKLLGIKPSPSKVK